VIAPFEITLAQTIDARDIAELSRDAIEHGLNWRWTEPRVLNTIRDPATNVVVVRRNGNLRGFAVMRYGDDEAHVVLFAVRDAERRTGMGSALLGWLEATLRVAGIFTVRLEVRAANEAAIAFYKRHGFVDAGRRAGYYEGVEDATRMVKRLESSAV
jgi:ribosomal protein S18 acetylase RimI-like enzyme